MRKLWYGLDLEPITDVEAEGLLRNIDSRRILYTILTTDKGQCQISTIFLVLDHAWDDGPPMLWETMAFGGPRDECIMRYRSEADAILGHAEAVADCRAAVEGDGARIIAEETTGRATA